MTRKTATLIGCLVGLIVMIIPLPSIIRSSSLRLKGSETTGTVTSIGRQLSRKSELRKITVTFIDSDNNRITATASKRSYVQQGDIVKLWYDPADHEKITFGDTNGYNMRAVFVGGLFFLICFVFFKRAYKDDKAGKKLMQTGKKISAEFVSIERNEEYRMGQNNPWFIKCRWTDNMKNREYYFKSSNYVIDPAPFMSGRMSVEVFIDPEDPSKYYMDQSFLPADKTIGPVIKLF